MENMSNVKRRLITSMIAILLLVITIFGITYAYFTAKIKGNTSTDSASLSAGRLQLVYRDGNGLIELLKIEPGIVLETKTFTVTNEGTGYIDDYDVILENVINELKYYEDLTYTLTCTSSSSDTCIGTSGVFPTSNTTLVTNSIDVGVTHTYELTVTYNETNIDQSDDMNKIVSAKVNIIDDDEYANYNNVLIYGNSKQSTLPAGYTELEYIEATGTQYIDTGVTLTNNSTFELEFQLTEQQYGKGIYGSYTSGGSRFEGILRKTTQSSPGNIEYGFNNEFKMDITQDLNKHVLKQEKDKFYYDGDLLYTFSSSEFTQEASAYIGHINVPTNNTLSPIKAKIYSCKIYDNGTLVRDYVPAKNSSNVVGLYDKITNTFYTNNGSGSFSYGALTASPSTPLEIKSVGNLVTDTSSPNYNKYEVPITLTGKNMFDKSKYLLLSDFDNYNTSTNYHYTTIQLKPNTTYRVSIIRYNNFSGTLNGYLLIDRFNGINSGYYTSINHHDYPNHSGAHFVYTTRSDGLLYIGYNGITQSMLNTIWANTDIQIEEGTTATAYTPYVAPLSTTVYLDQPLRKVGDYSDYIDFKKGKVIRQVGEYKFNGSEEWVKHTTTSNNLGIFRVEGIFDTLTGVPITNTLMSHFTLTDVLSTATWNSGLYRNAYTSSNSGYIIDSSRIYLSGLQSELADFKSWLSTQYNNGTPVQYLYPLATETSESITLPKIQEDYTKVNVNTTIRPSKIEVKK